MFRFKSLLFRKSLKSFCSKQIPIVESDNKSFGIFYDAIHHSDGIFGYFKQKHNELGPLVYLSGLNNEKILIANHPKYLPDKGLNERGEKLLGFYVNFFETFAMQNKENWKEEKQELYNPFQKLDKIVANHSYIFTNSAELLLSKLANSANKDVNLVELVVSELSGIMNEVMFGEKNIPASEHIDCFNACVKSMEIYHNKYFGKETTKQEIEEAENNLKIYKAFINKRLKNWASRNIDGSCYFDQYSIKLQKEELYNHASILVFAGFHTTSSLITSAIHSISHHKEVLSKLRIELDSFEGSIISISDLGKCKYLGACLNETLRLYPSIPINLKQTSEDIELEGYKIQAHTPYIISDTSFSDATDLWNDKEKFEPERFFNRENIKFNNQVIPFGYGQRMCPAKNIALMISRVMVSTIFKNYNIIPLGSFDQARSNFVHGGKFRDPLMIKIEKRNNL